MSLLVQQVINEIWDEISPSPFSSESPNVPLSDWQRSELENIQSPSGIRCLLRMWFNSSLINFGGDEDEVLYCNATWDNVYCWPPTRAGTVINRLCSETFLETRPNYAGYLEGNAIRVCQENATWLHGIKTNYEECALSFEAYERRTEQERKLVSLVQHMLFIGSILSFASICTALSIFYFYRCLWSDRIKVHVHLMLALLLRFILLFVITEPFVLNRSSNYRDVDILCKAIISVYLFATVASVSWMFIQGLYLNSKLTTSVFSSGTECHFIVYYFIGWAIPAILLVLYLAIMIYHHHTEGKCWKGYADMPEMWILLGPMLLALLLNAIFLMNILRIVLEKVRSTNLQSDSSQILAAAKATILLFPVLGINNLLLLYNPGGEYEKYYVTLNTFFGSTQGIFVSIVYCFNSGEVHDAIRRSYNRVTARRSGRGGHLTRPHHHIISNNNNHDRNTPMMMMVEIPTRRDHVSQTNLQQAV